MIIDSKVYSGPCACGKTHKMITEFCVIEKDALKHFEEYFKEYCSGKCRAAVYDENTYEATKDRHIRADFTIVLPSSNLHADEKGVALLQERLPRGVDCIIAVGSGTIHDISRYCAYTNGTEFVSCPTAASVDGFCSSVAAMTWNGCKKTLTAVAPKMVVADTNIIKDAPIRLAKSGFGDMVGKFIALTDWKIGNIITGEFYCDRIAEMTKTAAQDVIDSIEGIINGEASAYEKLTYGLLLSGLAMQMMENSRPASGAEHHISHLIEMHPAGFDFHSTALHGEKVGVGTLMAVKEYSRLRQLNKPCFREYKPYRNSLFEIIFGADMAIEIVAENKSDCATGITKEALENSWDKICCELDSIPSYADLKAIFEKYDIMSTLEHIEVDPGAEQILLDCSPMVRNRLTLMRLRKCIGTIPVDKVILAAHRGDKHCCPENTLPAFVSAIKKGADMIETDVHITADGELIIMHDSNTKRTTGHDSMVSEMTLAQLKELDAGAWFSPEFSSTKIPTVKEFIDLIKPTNLSVNWELKDYVNEVGRELAFRAADALITLIEENGLVERSIVNSFDNEVITYIYKKHGHRFPIHGQGIGNCTRHTPSDVYDEILFDWCCLYPEQKGKSPIDFENNFTYCTESNIAPCVCIKDDLEAYEKAIRLGCKMFTSNNIDEADDILRKLKQR